MKRSLALATVLTALALAGSTAQAQPRIEIGPRAGFDLSGDVEEFYLGADGRVKIPVLPITINGAFDLYFPDDFDFFQLSLNAFYEFGPNVRVFTPYVGGGLGFSSISVDDDFGGFADADDTDVGLNLIGGAVFGFGNLRPFGQAQITFGDVDLVTVGGGVLFRIGG